MGGKGIFRGANYVRPVSNVATRGSSFPFFMHHLIYLSWATPSFSDDQLQELLLEARNHNTQFGITGLLLYGNGCFVQVLEGERDAIHSLYEQIKCDPRHRDVTTYADKTIAQRAFADWAMAFHRPTPQQFTDLIGYLEPAHVQLDAARLSLMDMHLLDLLRSFTQP